MVGNDVVDLLDPETAVEGLNPRFDERVFTSDERRQLAAASDAHILRWTMWAAKESAYKLAKRFKHSTAFAHSLFETELGENGRGTVRHGAWCCAVTVSREGPTIHAIATADHPERERIVAGLDHVEAESDPSVSARELAIASVARHLDVEPSVFTITSGADRIPPLRLGGLPLGHLSLSHHGTLVALAWMPPTECIGIGAPSVIGATAVPPNRRR